ncbi:uncharacterized protein LOC114758801 [Neltuma alba]|uniref:uncharacterized protein LOC114758801 n=1 Tax=Neltuma alba TaxID=207710 RepID=UPI0010A42092|nr:uncharacterized protein LOC114758801 [Prosopis alba]
MPCWEPPGEGKVKFNVDGSFDVRKSLRGCSGLARNQEGVVLCGFLHRMPSGSSLSTEIWSILWALKVAWDRGFRNLEIEGDCAVAVNAVIKGVGKEHPESGVVHEVQMTLERDWVVDLHVCDREKQIAADALAKFASTLVTDLSFLSELPSQLGYIVKEDSGCGRRRARNLIVVSFVCVYFVI